MQTYVHGQSPAVRTRLKARHSESAEARAVVRAAGIWEARPTWIPVVWGRRHLGWMRGRGRGRGVLWYAGNPTEVPFVSDDDAINKCSILGYRWAQTYWKSHDAGVIDNWYDLWGLDGNPPAGNWSGSANTFRQFVGTTAGAMWTGGNVSPLVKYVVRASVMACEESVNSVILYDRVGSYDACTMSASTQTMTNTLAATRYISTFFDANRAQQNQPGLQIFVEADSVHNSTAANLTGLTYTNQAGTTGQSVVTTPTLSKIVSLAAPTNELGARNVIAAPGLTTVGRADPYLPLAAGDIGARKIEGFTWSAAPTGTCSFVLQFPIALMPDVTIAGMVHDHEFVSGIDVVNKRIYDDACLSYLYCPHVSTASQIDAWTEFVWG